MQLRSWGALRGNAGKNPLTLRCLGLENVLLISNLSGQESSPSCKGLFVRAMSLKKIRLPFRSSHLGKRILKILWHFRPRIDCRTTWKARKFATVNDRTSISPALLRPMPRCTPNTALHFSYLADEVCIRIDVLRWESGWRPTARLKCFLNVVEMSWTC
jgi:hypothetical protein